MEIANKTIVLMIDYDNFNKNEYLEILFEELEQMGNVVYKGAFYANTKDKSIDEKIRGYGFNDFIIEPKYSNSKNAVDIRIALDIMEWLDREYVNCFCIATTDSDFAPIVNRIKQKNKFVIGAGNEKSSEEYKKLFHRFISVDKILEARNETNDSEKDKLISIVNKIISDNLETGSDFVQFSVVIEQLYLKMPDFNPKNYSEYKKPSTFFQKKLDENYKFKREGKTLFIGNQKKK